MIDADAIPGEGEQEPVAEVAEAAPEPVAEASEPEAALELGGDEAPVVEPEVPATDVVVKAHGDITYYRSDAYAEFPCEGGVMRCEAGHYVVSDADGLLTIMPPEVFAETFPELQDAPAEGGE